VIRALKWITENFWWKLMALAIAVVIWALVSTEPELATFATVHLEYKNLPDDLEITSDTGTAVSLELRGPSGALRNLGESGGIHPAVILDMSDVQPGARTFPIGDGNVRLPRGVRLMRAVPSEVQFHFDRRATRTVQIVPRFTGEGANGYQVDHFSVEPKKLDVVGPADRVARITSVVTDPVDVSTVVGSSEFRVNAFIEDPYVRFVGSPQVTVSVTMKKK
jgi:YbbR domain-containing protein